MITDQQVLDYNRKILEIEKLKKSKSAIDTAQADEMQVEYQKYDAARATVSAKYASQLDTLNTQITTAEGELDAIKDSIISE